MKRDFIIVFICFVCIPAILFCVLMACVPNKDPIAFVETPCRVVTVEGKEYVLCLSNLPQHGGYSVAICPR